jgi:hypothetical protein
MKVCDGNVTSLVYGVSGEQIGTALAKRGYKEVNGRIE